MNDTARHIEQFLIDNDLAALESRIGQFNIFDALGVARMELRHSNFLAWVLDPHESHGLGEAFCRDLMLDIIRRLPESGRPQRIPAFESDPLGDVRVRREWRNIDITIHFPTLGYVLAIENKVDTAEHGDQLSRYAHTLRCEYPHLTRAHVLLSARGDVPSDPAWISYTYADVYRSLFGVRQRTSVSQDVGVFLDHYLNLIGTRFMEDVELDSLCKRIYLKHRQAIDTIVERAHAGSSDLLSRIADRLQSGTSTWRITSDRGAKWLGLTLQDWETHLPPIGIQAAYSGPRWLQVWFSVEDDDLTLSVWTHETSDEEFRRSVVERLWANDAKYGIIKARRSHGKQYTVHRELVAEEVTAQSDLDLVIELAVSKATLLAQRFVDLPDLVKEAEQTLGRPLHMP